MRELPTEAQIIEWFKSLSNWGRWGADDQHGTLNLITNESRLHAASLIRDGTIISCARTVPFGRVGLNAPRHFMHSTGDSEPATGSYGRSSTADTFLIDAHGMTTHLDAPAHVLWRSTPNEERTLFNGRSPRTITAEGAGVGSIELAGGGVVGRGVLLDIAGLFGVDSLSSDTVIFPEDLEAAEERQNVQTRSGDVLFVRTGFAPPTQPRKPGIHEFPGLQAACLPWLRERDVALLGCDTPNDVLPEQYPNIGLPIHGVGIAGLGLWLIDNCDHEALARYCREVGRWEFFVAISPIKWEKATGSPVNPLACF